MYIIQGCKGFHGDVAADVANVRQFVEHEPRTASPFEGLCRQSALEDPTIALCKAIANTIMHRK